MKKKQSRLKATAYVNQIKPILNSCGKLLMWQVDLDGVYLPPYKIPLAKGEQNLEFCKAWQEHRKQLIDGLTARFEGKHEKNAKPFPLCCKWHSNLIELKEFNRDSFISVPELVADKIIYTINHILTNCENEDYYKDITDYIEYVIHSFGQMPKDCGERLYLGTYLINIVNFLKQEKQIPNERRERLLEFLDLLQNPTKQRKSDIDHLIFTYQRWLKIFPFEISCFKSLKPYFENKIPVLNGKFEKNKYSGLAKSKIQTRSSLIAALQNVTKKMIGAVNMPKLVRNGKITNINAELNEIDGTKLIIEVEQLVKKYSKGELKYVKVLKKWLKVNKKYFNQLRNRLKDSPKQDVENPLKQDVENPLKQDVENPLKQDVENPPKQDVENPPKQDVENSPNENVEFVFKNNFDNVKEEDVYKHFYNGLVDSKMLSEIKLKQYLKAAFEVKEVPEQLFKLKNVVTKKIVMNVFYLYYKDIASKPYGKQIEYARLLGEYFQNYKTNTVRSNFSKSNY